MMNQSVQTSPLRAALQLYDTWGFKAFVFVTALVIGTAVALVLDLRFGVPQGTVLLYLVPLITVLVFAAPAVYLAFRRSKRFSVGDITQNYVRVLSDYPMLARSDIGNVMVGGDMNETTTIVRPSATTGSPPKAEYAIEDAVDVVLRKLQEVSEQLHTVRVKRTIVLKVGTRTISRYSYIPRTGRIKFSRPGSELHKRP